ncbi:cellulase family glycosylhydrolase [Streptosporangiaceae bacterium NEAU-GS5]|nr:cellulase family glycosylhydrolase [Streptosporangiaceae bacterium NEAU-GS5]
MSRRALTALLCLLVTLAIPLPAHAGAGGGFVTRQGSNLTLNGTTFRFFGSNNYYLAYQSRAMADDVFKDAKAAGFTVIRTWGWLDTPTNGVQFQTWDGGVPAYNDGPNGLERLDYVLYKARQNGIKLIIPFTNNWGDFGGMDQYVRVAGKTYHDDFYTDPTVRGWFKAYISHLLNRTNTLTGVKYKDDPTVMTWELANEPRCGGSGAFPVSPGCSWRSTLAWADEMSRHIKSIDHHHLVSVGDEGFTCDAVGTDDFMANCGAGIDNAKLTALPAIDSMSFHLYPDGWGKTVDWGTQWIIDHVKTAKRLNKAVTFGEFGLKDKATRNPVYRTWMDAFKGGNGFLYWILSGSQDDGTLYPDFDGFTVYCPTPVCQTVTNAGTELLHGQRTLPPVADNDTAVTEFNTPVTVKPLANDIAYRTYLKPSTIALTGTGFTLSGDTVTFTPAPGFVGKATAHYTVKDAAGHRSNTADIVVTVKPDPTAAIAVESWEDGIGAWAPGNWQANAGTVAQTPDFHTAGSFGMHVSAADGGWFGTTYTTPLDLSGKSAFKYDLKTGATGTSTALALQVGPSFTWCQGPFTWVPENAATQTLETDLFNGVSCDQESLKEVHGVLLFIGSGEFDIDNLRAE